LYLRVFPECANGETVIGDTAEGNATEISEFSSAPGADPGDIHALAATVKDLEQKIAGISRRLEELSRAGDGERKSRDRSHKRKTRPNYRRSNWTPLWSVLVPGFN
jgi:hypothetical protein